MLLARSRCHFSILFNMRRRPQQRSGKLLMTQSDYNINFNAPWGVILHRCDILMMPGVYGVNIKSVLTSHKKVNDK